HFFLLELIEWLKRTKVAWPGGVLPPTRGKRNATNSMMMPLEEFRSARRLRPGGATSKRVEDAAPQPAGGGVAPQMPVMNADEPRDAKSKDRTMHETRAGGVTARSESKLDDCHPTIPALLAETR